MKLSQIVLRLARNPGYPEGDHDQGYVIVAPLDSEARLDVAAWRDVKSHCTVRRFNGEKDISDGLLTHRGSHWYFHYDEEDEGHGSDSDGGVELIHEEHYHTADDCTCECGLPVEEVEAG
ncbi:MAG: hypothetical protein CMK07_03125, partial [Ponticaulis sp.]|nr:hypothetical protein [Ponticaulis sp.]